MVKNDDFVDQDTYFLEKLNTMSVIKKIFIILMFYHVKITSWLRST